MNDALKHKVVVIVGGTAGLGLSAARACLASGAKIVAVGRDEASVAAARLELGPWASVLCGDATNPEVAERAIATALKDFNGFHALYHVAGGSGRKQGDGPLHEITNVGWQVTLDMNLTSVLNSNRAAVLQFLKQGSAGSILNMGSVLASSPSPDFFATHAYAAAKAGIEGLTKACASYYAPNNIRFNVVAPGLIETPMSARAVTDKTIQSFIRAKQPLDGGRIGYPDDLDAAVVFLLSDASRFITGQVLKVDGGWSVSEGHSKAAD
jgi:NAD(P)-dependent dehydrogenase (short-subunit alcohol dehydrogenase family)